MYLKTQVILDKRSWNSSPVVTFMRSQLQNFVLYRDIMIISAVQIRSTLNY